MVYKLNTHLTFVTKYQKKVKTDRATDEPRSAFEEVCHRHHVTLDTLDTFDTDHDHDHDHDHTHAHLPVSYPPNVAPSTLAITRPRCHGGTGPGAAIRSPVHGP